jgi:hypothetical protein
LFAVNAMPRRGREELDHGGAALATPGLLGDLALVEGDAESPSM